MASHAFDDSLFPMMDPVFFACERCGSIEIFQGCWTSPDIDGVCLEGLPVKYTTCPDCLAKPGVKRHLLSGADADPDARYLSGHPYFRQSKDKP